MLSDLIVDFIVLIHVSSSIQAIKGIVVIWGFAAPPSFFSIIKVMIEIPFPASFAKGISKMACIVYGVLRVMYT